VLAVAITYVAIVATHVPFIFEEAGKQMESGEAPAAEPEVEMTAGAVFAALGMLVLLLLASPFLAGIQNAIGILIIGFALYEAWRVNAHAPLRIEGPLQIGVRPKETPV